MLNPIDWRLHTMNGYVGFFLYFWWWAVLWIVALTRAKNKGVAVAAFFLPPILLLVANWAGKHAAVWVMSGQIGAGYR